MDSGDLIEIITLIRHTPEWKSYKRLGVNEDQVTTMNLRPDPGFGVAEFTGEGPTDDMWSRIRCCSAMPLR